MEMNYFDVNVPFEARTLGELAHEMDYIGRIIEGPFKNFNLFSSVYRPTYWVLVFERGVELPMDKVEHFCDKHLVEKTWRCNCCGHVMRSRFDDDCDECGGWVQELDVVKMRHRYFGKRTGKRVTDPFWIATCSKARHLPHNLDKNGYSEIKPFETFRIGMFFFYYDPWNVCYMDVTDFEY